MTNTWMTLKSNKHLRLSKRELERSRRMMTGSNKLQLNGIKQQMKHHRHKNNGQKQQAFIHTDPANQKLLCNPELELRRKNRTKRTQNGTDRLSLRNKKKQWKIG